MNIIFFICLIFLLISSIFDFIKREIPDTINYGFIIISLVYSIFTQNYISILIGTIIFLWGYLMYCKNAWGGADVKILTGLCLIVNIRISIIVLIFLSILIFPYSYICKKIENKKSIALIPLILVSYLLSVLFYSLI